MSVITVTPSVELNSNPPRVRLDISDANLPGYFAADVVRNNPDGTVVSVRTPAGGPVTLVTSGANRVAVLYDYEAPYGAPVTYSTLQSPSVVSAPITVNDGQVWLTHVGVPELSMPVKVAELGERSRTASRSVYQPLGRRTPVVFTDGQRKAAEYQLTLMTVTEGERFRMDTLLEDTSPLLLNVPTTLEWGVGAEYVAVGDAVEQRLYDYAGESRRYWNLPCTVVDRPAGGTQAERSLLDLTTYPTLAAVASAYSSLAAVANGP